MSNAAGYLCNASIRGVLLVGVIVVSVSACGLFDKEEDVTRNWSAQRLYSAGKTEGAVDIDFRYNKNALDGPLKKLPQTGSSWYDDKTAGWKVSPFWPVKMPYLVIDKSKTALDNDAAWFVVRTSA